MIRGGRMRGKRGVEQTPKNDTDPHESAPTRSHTNAWERYFVTGLAALLGLFISRSISRPVTELKNATLEISKGELDTRIAINSKDEIGELAASFIRMIKDLNISRDSLELGELK